MAGGGYIQMKNLTVVKHPLVVDLVTKLRDAGTNSENFRKYTKIITYYLMYEALNGVSTRNKKVSTQTEGIYMGKEVVETIKFFAVLREGVGMLIAPMELLSTAEFDLIGVKRNDADPFNAPATMYFDSFKNIGNHISHVFLMDQMFATGGTMLIILDSLFNKNHFKGRVDIISVIAAKIGVERVLKQYPQVKITCAGYDTKLTNKGYIYPGLGDAADRYFNTLKKENHTR